MTRQTGKLVYILSHDGYGDSPTSVERQICDDAELSVVDRIGDDFVVEGQPLAVQRLVRSLRGWASSPQRRVRQPNMYTRV